MKWILENAIIVLLFITTISAVEIAIITLGFATTQEAENKVIIEQLCNLDKTSYFCKRLKRKNV